MPSSSLLVEVNSHCVQRADFLLLLWHPSHPCLILEMHQTVASLVTKLVFVTLSAVNTKCSQFAIILLNSNPIIIYWVKDNEHSFLNVHRLLLQRHFHSFCPFRFRCEIQSVMDNPFP